MYALAGRSDVACRDPRATIRRATGGLGQTAQVRLVTGSRSSLMATAHRRQPARLVEPVPPKSELPRTYPSGRLCRVCDKPISTYNGSRVCWPCQDAKVRAWRPRRESLAVLMQEPGIG